ncbi:MAG: 50S ribosomal protein L11 methyltransferase, partial [Bacteroidetes bacterium]
MDYLKYCLTCSPELTEILLAFLSGEAFEVFEETETGLNAFLPASA